MGVGADGDSDSQSVDYGNPGRAVVLGCIGGLCLWFLVWVTAIAGDFYVSPAGSNGNAGTEASPWATVAYAATQAQAGDTVWIKAGTYPGNVTVANSGALGSPIVFRAYPGDERLAVIQGGQITVKGSKSYIQFLNLKVQNSPSRGINIEGPTNPALPPVSFITVAGNHFYDTVSSGVSVWGVPWGTDPGDYDNATDIIIEGNLFERCVNGGWNECITVANGAKRVTVRRNEMRLAGNGVNGGEGIDFKEGVQDSVIHNNYINGISRRAIYIDGGQQATALTKNIRVYNNTTVNDPGDSIFVMSEGAGDVDEVYIYNNLAVNSQRNGFGIYQHPNGVGIGTVNNVQFINNTSYLGGRAGTGWGGIDINMPAATNIIVRNNIAWLGNGFDIRVNTPSATVDHNLCRNTLCETRTDPLFVNPGIDPALFDFRLQETSPALDIGDHVGAPLFDIVDTTRYQGAWFDLGAYERPAPCITNCPSGGCHATL